MKTSIFIKLSALLLQFRERLSLSPVLYRLVRGSFWSLTGAAFSRGATLIAFIIVARFLGKEGFGQLGIIQSTVVMFGTFAGFGMGLTATKHIAEFRTREPAKAGRILGLSGMVSLISGGLMAVALVILAPWLAAKTLAAPHLGGLLRISAGLLFLIALNGAQTGALAGFEAFKTIAKVNLLAGLLSLPLMVGGVWLGGLRGAVWGLVASMGVNWSLNHLALAREARKAGVPFTFKGCGQELQILWQFSLPAVLGGALVGPVLWACNAMLVNQPGGYAEMGLYSAVTRIKQAPEMILVSLMAPMLPILSEQFGKKDVASYNRTVLAAFVISCGLLVPFGLMGTSLPDLLLLPYGAGFKGDPGLVQWLLVHSILVGLFWPFGSILASMNRMWFAWVYNVSWGGVFLLLSALLIPHYSALGLASAFAISYLITALPCVLYIYRYEKAFIRETPLSLLSLVVIILYVVCLATSRFASPWLAAVISVLSTIIFAMFLHDLLRRRGIRLKQAIST